MGNLGALRRWIRGTRPVKLATSAQTIDLADPAVTRDPFPYLEALRRQGPIHWLSRHHAYLVLGYADVKHILTRPDMYVTEPRLAGDTMLGSTNRDTHRRARRLLATRLEPEAARSIAAATSVLAGELVQRHEDSEFDVVTDLAAPLANNVAGHVVGVERDVSLTMRGPAEVMFPARVSEWLKASAALGGVPGGVPMVAELQRTTTLSEAQVLSLVRALWIAAGVTTRLAMPSAVLLLIEEPRLQELLRADPRLVAPLVDEALRLHPPEPTIIRLTVADVTLAGARIAAGSKLYVCLSAANRDPAYFEDPEQLRLDRPLRHLTFGHGPHRCPGALIGRNTMVTGLRALLESCSSFNSARPLTSLQWIGSAMHSRGLERLSITRATAVGKPPSPQSPVSAA